MNRQIRVLQSPRFSLAGSKYAWIKGEFFSDGIISSSNQIPTGTLTMRLVSVKDKNLCQNID